MSATTESLRGHARRNSTSSFPFQKVNGSSFFFSVWRTHLRRSRSWRVKHKRPAGPPIVAAHLHKVCSRARPQSREALLAPADAVAATAALVRLAFGPRGAGGARKSLSVERAEALRTGGRCACRAAVIRPAVHARTRIIELPASTVCGAERLPRRACAAATVLPDAACAADGGVVLVGLVTGVGDALPACNRARRRSSRPI